MKTRLSWMIVGALLVFAVVGVYSRSVRATLPSAPQQAGLAGDPELIAKCITLKQECLLAIQEYKDCSTILDLLTVGNWCWEERDKASTKCGAAAAICQLAPPAPERPSSHDLAGLSSTH